MLRAIVGQLLSAPSVIVAKCSDATVIRPSDMLNWKTGAPKPERASGIHWHTDKAEMFSYRRVLHAPHAREVSPSYHHYPNYSEMDEMLATLCVWVSAAHVAAMC